MTRTEAPPAPGHAANVASHLTRMAASRPRGEAIVFLRGGTRESWTYERLNAETDRAARGLEACGIGRGTRTVLMVPPGPEFFTLTFALFKAGAVPVLVDPGMGIAGLGRCLGEACPSAFIGVPKAHAARWLFGWARRTVSAVICVGPRLSPGMTPWRELMRRGGEGPYLERETAAGDTAAILFTSGSTGPPKGAVYTHGNFMAQVELLRGHFGIEPGETDLPTFPLFALFGPALGMRSIIPEMDFTRPAMVEPANIIGPINEHGVTHLFGSPALLDRVGRYAEARGIRLPSLRRVVSAGAPVPAEVALRFAGLLGPGARVHTPYGATEALPVASIATDEIAGTRGPAAEGRGVCVGRPLPGVEVRVMALSDAPAPEWRESLAAAPGEVGEILVRGPQVTREYFGRPEATAQAKVGFPDGSVGHRMGDVGYIDEAGRLWFCGRKSQRVVTSAGTLFTIQCEAVFNQHPLVYRSALVGVGRAPRQRPVIVIELEKGTRPSEALKGEILALGRRRAHTRGISDLLFHRCFPVDIRHNSKIFREKLAVWAASMLETRWH